MPRRTCAKCGISPYVKYLTQWNGATALAPIMLAAIDGVHPADDLATHLAIAGVAKNEIAT